MGSSTTPKYPHFNCPEAYIKESGRALGDRIKEHLKVPSPIQHHSSSTGHPLTQGPARNIKEAIIIRVNDPLNRNLGKYQLPHIWDILQDTPALQVKTTNHFPLPLLVPPLHQVPQPPNSSPPIQGGGTCTLIGKNSNGGA